MDNQEVGALAASGDDVEFEGRESEGQPVVEEILPKKRGASLEKADHVQIRIPRKAVWSLAITGLVLVIGLAAWQFRWYQSIVDSYNTTSVSLKVKEGDKFAIGGAKVILDGKDYTTDDNGKVSIDRIVAGDYTVKITKEGYTPLEKTLTVKRGDNELALYSLDKLPEALFSVKGAVRDFVSDAALVDVQVTLEGKTARSNPAGEFSFEKLAPGDYKLILSKSGYADKEQALTVKDSDATLESVALVPAGQVVFVSNRDGKRALYLSNYDGSDQRQLVQPQNGGEDFSPILSPDGRWVVFSSTRDGITSNFGSSLSKLYVVGRDGKELKKVSDDVAHSSLIWSPNSRFVYYEGYADKGLTSPVRRFYDLTKGSTFDLGEDGSGVTFSNDGNSVVYTTSKDGKSNLQFLNLTTGERKLLIQREVSYMRNLSFSSNDKSVFYETLLDQTARRFEITIANLNDTGVAMSNDSTERKYVTSPDGKQRVFIEERDGKKDLYVLPTGGQEKRLTTLGVLNDRITPIWDGTGSYVVFALQRQGENALYIVSTQGGDPKKVTDFLDDQSGASY